MGTMYPLNPGTHEDTTAELMVDQEQVRDLRRLNKLLEQRRTGRPAAGYTRATIIVTAAAALDWVAVAIHTTASGSHQGPWLGVHQAFVATFTIVAASLGMGWAVWNGACRREADRDEMEQIRHRQLVAAVEQAARVWEQREWASYAAGLRDAVGQGGPRQGPDRVVRRMNNQRQPGR